MFMCFSLGLLGVPDGPTYETRHLCTRTAGRKPTSLPVIQPLRFLDTVARIERYPFRLRSTYTTGPTRPTREKKMQLGMVGLGRMGANIVRRLSKGAGFSAVVYDKSADAVASLTAEGAAGAGSLAEFVRQLAKPR